MPDSEAGCMNCTDGRCENCRKLMRSRNDLLEAATEIERRAAAQNRQLSAPERQRIRALREMANESLNLLEAWRRVRKVYGRIDKLTERIAQLDDGSEF